MKNLYKQTMEEIKLDDAAKERIYNGVVNKLKEEKTEKKRTPFSLKAFRLATACASAALVCGAAIGTGVYFGTKDNSLGNDAVEDYPEYKRYYCYYMGYELEEYEQDVDNFELTLYYGFDEQAVRNRYEQVLYKADKYGYGKVTKYEIILTAMSGNVNETGYNDRVTLKSWQINDIDDFPFGDYKVHITEEDGEVVERIYEHSEKVIVPEELLILNDDTFIDIYMYDRIEYEGGVIENDRGSAIGFLAVDNNSASFFYRLDNGKVVIDKSQFDKYVYAYDINGEPLITLPQSVICNAKPLYR